MSSGIIPPSIIDEERCADSTLRLFLFTDLLITRIEQNKHCLWEHVFNLDNANSDDRVSLVADQLYSVPFLTYAFHEVKISFLASHYLAVPAELIEEDEAKKWLNVTTTHEQGNGYIGTFTLSVADMPKIVVAWQEDTYNFLRRTYINSSFLPLQGSVWEVSREKSLYTEQRVFSFIIDLNSIDIILFHRGSLIFSNRFDRIPYSGQEGQLSNQLLFWWAATCKTMGINKVNGDIICLYTRKIDHKNIDCSDELKEFRKIILNTGVFIEEKNIIDLIF